MEEIFCEVNQDDDEHEYVLKAIFAHPPGHYEVLIKTPRDSYTNSWKRYDDDKISEIGNFVDVLCFFI